MTGGPSAFGRVGWNVLEGTIPNESDTELYLYDIAAKTPDPVTRNFDPAVGQAVWSRADGCLWFSTTDRSFRNLYRYDPKTRIVKNVQTGVDVVDGFDIAPNRPMAIYSGSGPNVTPKAYVLDLRTGERRLLADLSGTDQDRILYGKVETWTFRNARGTEIDGMVYLPLDFRPDRTWPCIVYYYGGTTPVSRDFGGRYPKEVWAANGYVVYVPQPSGAIGYGQAFSAFHVNDLGTVVVDEIIDGTRQFLKAHPFVDPKRVGCIGASYGGFMTMLLLTKTDMFAAGISHAGISSISSYWGEGYWGYSYSATAAANSFPWNRPDIFVTQSPLFSADKVTTPLLLLHGKEDTNVPPGESIQFYTALKLLGKTAEYIEVEGQNHHIMEPAKRLLWTKTILAWFDRWLKQHPEWWEQLYPASGAGK